MLRIIFLNISPRMLLTACAIGICSVNVEAQTMIDPGRKQMYSNRAIGYTVPTPYYGTPAMPLFVVPPDAPGSIQVAHTGGVQAEVNVPAESVAPVTLAPIDVEPPAPQTIKTTAPLPPVLYPVHRVNVYDELDALYARLAKILLEKHQLNESLTLVKSIKSEVTRTRTLVDLAEYVSRDKNYQSEAEQLYNLALYSMEALGKRTDSPPAAPIPEEPAVPAPEVQPPPAERPSPILLQDDSAKRNGTGKLPPPSPPRGNGVDGGLGNLVGSL